MRGFNNPKVLLVYFARDVRDWKSLFEDDKKNFGHSVRLSMATTKDFSKEVMDSNIIYLRGGDTYKLLKELRKINFKKLIKGKVIGGSSAGVYVLVKYYYSNHADELRRGLGILNIKAFCHFSQDKKDKLKMLKEYKEKLKTYVLKDTEFIVLKEDF